MGGAERRRDGTNPIRIIDGGCQGHVTAVARPGDHDAGLVERGLRCNPVEQRSDVLDRVLALLAVVECLERPAKTGRPADVRVDDGDAQLVPEVVATADLTRPLFRVWPAVNVDDHRPRPRELRRWTIKDAGNLEPVEALPLHDFGIRKRGGIDAPHLAKRPAIHTLTRNVDRVHVPERSRTLQAEPQISAGRVPSKIADLPRW